MSEMPKKSRTVELVGMLVGAFALSAGGFFGLMVSGFLLKVLWSAFIFGWNLI